ncbi:MAG TPA: hypothetical protein VFS18_01635 [Actinomycetota bacterium]|nr:hypothetical protein [Actinomycetota bacterium]
MDLRKRSMMLAATVVVGLLAACGGDGGDEGVAPDAFAADICGAASDWVASIQERAGAIQTDFTSGDPEQGREVLGKFLDDVIRDTDDLIAQVDEAGTPDVDGGEEFADDLRAAFEESKEILVDVRADVEDLPDDPQQFAEAGQQMGVSIQEAFTEVSSSFEEPESDELREAFEGEESCNEITG